MDLRLLDSEQRRSVIERLREHNTLDRTELGDEIAMHHCHLPMLEEAQIIMIDGKNICRGENFEQYSEQVCRLLE